MWGPWTTESLWQPFWPVQPTKERALNLTKLQSFYMQDQTIWLKVIRNYDTGIRITKWDRPGSESCGLVSFARICAWAQSVAPPSSGRGQRRWACRSTPSRSSHPLPETNNITKSAQGQEMVDVLRWSAENCGYCSHPLGVLVPLEADKPKTSRLSVVIGHDADAHGVSWATERPLMSMFHQLMFYCKGSNRCLLEIWTPWLTVFVEHFSQLFIIHVFTKVFNIDISELLGSGTQLSLAFFARFEAAHKSASKWT